MSLIYIMLHDSSLLRMMIIHVCFVVLDFHIMDDIDIHMA